MSPMVRIPYSIEFALLGCLHRQPMHGYELYQHINQPHGVGLIWRIKQSQLYALMDKLESDGLIEVAYIEMQETHPQRKVYHLTQQGEETFLRWVGSPVEETRSVRMEFMAKLYFARQEGKEELASLLLAQEKTAQKWLESLQAQESKAETEFDRQVFSFRAGQVEATIQWLRSYQ